MRLTLAFDVYGTLIDTNGVVRQLQNLVGDKAASFADHWRSKQLEYSFRRGLMRQYQSFAVCTEQALHQTCSVFGIDLDDAQCTELMAVYRRLPAFADVPDSLQRLRGAGHAMYAFSNGDAQTVDGLLVNAEIRQYFDGVVSVEAVNSFKPDPQVYQHFLQTTGAQADSAWLISSNPFDVIGALAVQMRAAWIRRQSNAVFDPWQVEPTAVLGDLGGLIGRL